MINNSAEDEKCCMTGYPVMQRFFARLQIATKVAELQREHYSVQFVGMIHELKNSS